MNWVKAHYMHVPQWNPFVQLIYTNKKVK
jgi:hypothetical protein